jgi:hypothetical protein
VSGTLDATSELHRPALSACSRYYWRHDSAVHAFLLQREKLNNTIYDLKESRRTRKFDRGNLRRTVDDSPREGFWRGVSEVFGIDRGRRRAGKGVEDQTCRCSMQRHCEAEASREVDSNSGRKKRKKVLRVKRARRRTRENEKVRRASYASARDARDTRNDTGTHEPSRGIRRAQQARSVTPYSR